MIEKYFNFLIWDLKMFAGTLALIHALYAALYLRTALSIGRPSWKGFADFAFPATAYAHARVDLAVFVLGKLAWKPLFLKVVGFVAFEAAAYRALTATFGTRILTTPGSWTILAGQFVITILVSECAFYWIHRYLHKNRWLWSLHRVHHSAETMTFLTPIRQHPLEVFLQMAWIGLWSGSAAAVLAYATGTAVHPLMPTLMLCFSVFSESMSKLQHSHISTSFGMLDRILVSGAMHQIHHSAELRHRNRNYAANLAIFDWIFGTIYLPGSQEAIRLGLCEEELGENNPHKSVAAIYMEPLAYIEGMMKKHEPYAT